MNQVLDKIRNMVIHELDNMPEDSSQLSYDCWCLIDKIIDIWKDTYEIEEKESMVGYEEGYSRDGYSMRSYGNSNRMMPRYYEGNSYGGSRMGGGMSRGGGYSRDDGRHDMVTKLENLMNETHDERDREAIRRMIDQIR